MKRSHLKKACFFMVFGLCTLLAPSGVTLAADASGEEADYLALAGLLIRDGHFDRAEQALSQVDTEAPDLERGRYHTLRGILSLRGARFDEAHASFSRAMESGPHEPSLYLYRAQAAFGQRCYDAVLEDLALARRGGVTSPELHLLSGQAHRARGDLAGAWESVEAGLAQTPAFLPLLRLRVTLLVENRLYRRALEEGHALLGFDEARQEDVLVLAEALVHLNQPREAIALLEAARLRHPEHAEFLVALAHAWQADHAPRTAAGIFEQAAHTNPEYAFEAAEFFRRAGRIQAALYWNAQVDDQKKKIRQRLGLLLQGEQFEMAAAMEARLSRLGLLEDEDTRYALAYALYKIRDFARAESHLKHLTRSDLFAHANGLRMAMEACQAEAWECY